MDHRPFMDSWSQSDPNEVSSVDSTVEGRTRTFYEILNVSTQATRSEIRESYIRLKNMFGSQNPALYSLIGDTESHRMLGAVEEAFRALNDDYSRRRYDISIGIVTEDDLKPTSPEKQEPKAAFGAEVKVGFGGSMAENGNTTGTIRPATYAKSLPPKKYLDTDIVDRLNGIVAQATDLGDGGLYRKLRETAAISEEELHSRTKIGRDYIRAIEENAYDSLPQSVFVKGFVKSYLKALSVKQADSMVQAFAEGHKLWQEAKSTS